MPNKERGEMEIKISGGTYLMRPTFSCLCEIEDRAGVGLQAVAGKVMDGNLGIRDIVAIIYGGLVGSGSNPFGYDELGDIIAKEGYTKYMTPSVEFLNRALVGVNDGDEVDKEPGKKT